MFQQEKYKKMASSQLENTHIGRALKLSWNFGAWFAKNFISASAVARGSIGERDGLIPGQEYNRGREATYQGSAEAAKSYTIQKRPRRGSAKAAGATQG